MGAVLVKAGVVSRAEVDGALADLDGTDDRLEDALVEMGLVDEPALPDPSPRALAEASLPIVRATPPAAEAPPPAAPPRPPSVRPPLEEPRTSNASLEHFRALVTLLETGRPVAAFTHDLGKLGSMHLTALNVSGYEGHRAAAQRAFGGPERLLDGVPVAPAAVAAGRHMYERVDGRGSRALLLEGMRRLDEGI